jgi:hypothetical protein
VQSPKWETAGHAPRPEWKEWKEVGVEVESRQEGSAVAREWLGLDPKCTGKILEVSGRLLMLTWFTQGSLNLKIEIQTLLGHVDDTVEIGAGFPFPFSPLSFHLWIMSILKFFSLNTRQVLAYTSLLSLTFPKRWAQCILRNVSCIFRSCYCLDTVWIS